jgi:hypothetical protein
MTIHVYSDIAFGYKLCVNSMVLHIGFFIVRIGIRYNETRCCHKRILILKHWRI